MATAIKEPPATVSIQNDSDQIVTVVFESGASIEINPGETQSLVPPARPIPMTFREAADEVIARHPEAWKALA